MRKASVLSALFITLLWLLGIFLVPTANANHYQDQPSPTNSELSSIGWEGQHSPLIFQGQNQFNFSGKQQYHSTAFNLFGSKVYNLIQFHSASTLIFAWENFSTAQVLNNLFPFHFFF